MKKNRQLSIFGASGHGKIVLAAAKRQGYSIVAFYDNNSSLFNTRIHDVPVKGTFDDFDSNENMIIAIGSNSIRKKTADQFQLARWSTVIDPRSYMDGSVRIGAGSLICAGATVQIDSTLGTHTIINTNASVDHDCVIGNFVHIAPGVNLAGNVTVGDGAMIGIGASVIPGVSIGENSVVGAGSVVIKDVPNNTVVAGCPAKVIKNEI